MSPELSTGLTPNTRYEVAATWVADSSNSTAAPYTITYGGSSSTVTTKQNKDPQGYPGFDDGDIKWVSVRPNT